MNSRFVIATLVGFVALFVAGYLIWGLALAGFMAENFNNSMSVDPPNWLWLSISNLIWAAMLAYVFTTWANVASWQGGAKTAAILALFIASSYATGFYSMTTMYTGGLMAVIVDILSSTVWSAIGGAAIGAMLGRSSG